MGWTVESNEVCRSFVCSGVPRRHRYRPAVRASGTHASRFGPISPEKPQQEPPHGVIPHWLVGIVPSNDFLQNCLGHMTIQSRVYIYAAWFWYF